MTEIILKSYQVLEAIKKQPTYQAMIIEKEKIEHDYHHLISEFNACKEQYQTIMEQGGTYHPDFQQAAKALMLSKKALYEKPEVIRFRQFEQAIQHELDQLLRDIRDAISPHIKTPNPFGWLDQKGGCHVHQ